MSGGTSARLGARPPRFALKDWIQLTSGAVADCGERGTMAPASLFIFNHILLSLGKRVLPWVKNCGAELSPSTSGMSAGVLRGMFIAHARRGTADFVAVGQAGAWKTGSANLQ